MIIHGLEIALGEYIKRSVTDISELPESQVQRLLTRREANNDVGPLSESPLSAIIEESYFREVLDLAVEAAKGTSHETSAKRLRELVGVLDIYTIRNSHDHPNRTFPIQYWHKTACLATDSSIDVLNLTNVKDAYEAALEGRLQNPPDNWTNETRWVIPNNLPSHFDHDATGLVGRNEACEQVTEYLRNPRVPMVAVSATGGLGKTALVLEVLRNIAVSADSYEWLDRIVYASAKTERLTKTGIEKIESPASSVKEARETILDELRDGDESNDDVLKKYAEDRVLVCVDNLETLIVDAKSESVAYDEFENFHINLPPRWKVLVTSRVTVEGATSTYALSSLDAKQGQVLTRKYMRARGYEDADQESVERIVQAADRNPLAIRLIVDSLVAGSTLDSAISDTQDDIVKFSYTNLLNHIPHVSRQLLECLFVIEEPVNRFKAAKLLDCSQEQVAEGFSNLLRTSLCSRISNEGVEKYEISASVRDLLLRSPIDLETRNQVQERQREFRKTGHFQEKKQKSGTTPLSIFYVSDSIDSSIKYTLQEGFDAIKADPTSKLSEFTRDDIYQVMTDIESAASNNPDCLELRRVSAILRIKLDDVNTGIERLSQISTEDHFDPASAFELAKRLFRQDRYEDLRNVTKRLVDRGWADPSNSDEQTARRLIELHYLPKVWNDDPVAVAEDLSDWNDRDKHVRDSYACLYVESLLKISEQTNNLSTLNKCISIIENIIGTFGFGKPVVITSINLISTAAYTLQQLDTGRKFATRLSYFVDDYINLVVNSHNKYNLSNQSIKKWIQIIADRSDSGTSPLRVKSRWTEYLETGQAVESEPVDSNFYATVTFKHIRGYAFVENDLGESYFLHSSAYLGDWDHVDEGSHVLVTRIDQESSKDRTPIRSAEPAR